MIRLIKPKTTLRAKSGFRTIILLDTIQKKIRRVRIPIELYNLLPHELNANSIDALEKLLGELWRSINKNVARSYIQRIINAYNELSRELEGRVKLMIVKLGDLSLEDQNVVFENYVVVKKFKKTERVMALHRYLGDVLMLEGPIGFLDEYEKYLPFQTEDNSLIKAQEILRSHKTMPELTQERLELIDIIEEMIMMQSLISKIAG